MQAIETVTVGSGGAASITFSSIPDTFTDLKLVCSIRSSRTAVVDGLLVKPNNSGSNFSYRRLYGSGSSAVAATGSTAELALINSADNTSNTFGNAAIYIPNYAGSQNKTFSADSVTENNATSAFPSFYAGLWSDTSAITSLVLSSATGNNFVEHSTATLYGILAGSDGTTTVT